jgi:hypothetical protein
MEYGLVLGACTKHKQGHVDAWHSFKGLGAGVLFKLSGGIPTGGAIYVWQGRNAGSDKRRAVSKHVETVVHELALPKQTPVKLVKQVSSLCCSSKVVFMPIRQTRFTMLPHVM